MKIKGVELESDRINLNLEISLCIQYEKWIGEGQDEKEVKRLFQFSFIDKMMVALERVVRRDRKNIKLREQKGSDGSWIGKMISGRI